LRGVCIDIGATTTLTENKEYFLFEHGPNNYYVSRFDNVNAHFGSYGRKQFKVIEEPNQRFVARVAKWRNGYRMGDEFIISRPGPNGYYHVYLKERPNKGPVGSYITDFFEIIGPYKEDAAKRPKTPQIEEQPPPGTNTLPEVKPAENEPEIEPKVKITGVWIKKEKPKKEKAKKLTKVEQMEAEGQLNLFDFMEG
jgi:hypothetical protein